MSKSSLTQNKQAFELIQREKKWQEYLSAVRGYFASQEFIEDQTPFLVKAGELENHLDTFQLVWKKGSSLVNKELPTSPELHLKKALSLGFDKIYEIKTCFRNEEATQHHRPEFTMLEWY